MNIGQLFDEIQEKVSENKVEEAIELLKENLNKSEYYNEILIQSGKYKSLKKQKRIGILSVEEMQRIESRIVNYILELVEVIKKDKNVRPIIRENQKWGNNLDLRLDISLNLHDLNPSLGIKHYKTTDFADANDFLNEIYLEISEYVLPKTYGKDWMLIDENNEELSYPMIEERIMQTESGMEKYFDDNIKSTDFYLKKIDNTTHNKS